MRLNTLETQSAVWRKLQAYMAERLEDMRRKNDGDATDTETARTRGRIAQLKELLALGEPETAGAGATDNAAPIGAGVSRIM